MDVKEFTDANDEANKFKNRIFNAIPCESPVYALSFCNLECTHELQVHVV